MKLKAILSGLVLTLTLVLSGCIGGGKYQEIARYDLLPAEPINISGICRVKPLQTMSPAGRQMQFVDNEGRLTESVYVAWALAPELMLRRYLTQSFCCQTSDKEVIYDLSGTLVEFSLNSDKLIATISFYYNLRIQSGDVQESNKTGLISVQAPLRDISGESATKAMSECASQLASKIAEIIEE